MSKEVRIKTKNLEIISCDVDCLQAAIEGNHILSGFLGTNVPEGWSEFGTIALDYAKKKLEQDPSQERWWTWLPVHQGDSKLIGSCGFKGKPDSEGMVEIGYEIMPEYRGKGLATELAQALVDHAFSFDEVNTVQAHTLGHENASTRVLIKCGFNKVLDLEDQENGLIWKWELSKNLVKNI